MPLEYPKQDKIYSSETYKLLQKRLNIMVPQKMGEFTMELDDALKSENIEQILNLLKTDYAFQSLITHRGRKDQAMNQLYRGFFTVLGERFGLRRNSASVKEIFEKLSKSVSAEQVAKAVHEYGLPERILCDMGAVAHHQKNEPLFQWVHHVIYNQKDFLEDRTVLPTNLHDLGSFSFSARKDQARALEYNKEALAILGNQDPVLSAKIKIGRTLFNERIKSQDKARSFEEAGKMLWDAGIAHVFWRAKEYAAMEFLELAKKQKGKQVERRTDNLEKAREILLEVFRNVTAVNYPNAIVRAADALDAVYQEAGDKVESKKWARTAENMRNEFLYRY